MPPPTPRPKPRRAWGHIRKERSGKFSARYRTGPMAPYVSAPTTFTTRREAERWLDTARVDLERGEHRDPRVGTDTIGEYGARFISDHAAGLAPSTAAANTSVWATHV